MATVHISEAEAVQDFAGLLSRVRAGEQVVIESSDGPSITVQSDRPPIRRLSEILESLEQNESEALLDDEFGRDVEAAREWARQPRPSPWD